MRFPLRLRPASAVKQSSRGRRRRVRESPNAVCIEKLEDRTLLSSVTLSSTDSSFNENGGSTTVTATLDAPTDQDVFVNLDLGGTAVNNVGYLVTSNAAPISIDGSFDDWVNNPSIEFYSDPFNDTHDTDTTGANNSPVYVNHPDVDLRQFAVAHDDENLYLYFEATGQIGRTQVGNSGTGAAAGRYYVISTIDVDNNDATGYELHEGGYYPTTGGYDMNAEIEFYDGVFNTGHYLNHGAVDNATRNVAFEQQSNNQFDSTIPYGNWTTQGPFDPGFVNVIPGTYDFYTQWVYKNNDPANGGEDSVTFVKDRGPVVTGIITQAISADGHKLEMIVPYKGFLTDQNGNPIVDIGKILDISFSLEASPELAPAPSNRWASDTADPVNGYELTAAAQSPVSMIRIPKGQLSASVVVSGIDDAVSNPGRTAVVAIGSVIGATENGNQQLTLQVVDDDFTDIRMQSVKAATTSVTLEYEIVDFAALPFQIGFYRSADGLFDNDEFLDSITIDAAADLTVGQHTKTFTIGNGASQITLLGAGVVEIDADYQILVVADPTDSISETDADSFNEDNTVALTGAYHLAGGPVMYFGSGADETVSVTTAGSNLEMTATGLPLLTYAAADVSEFRLRGAAGNDTLRGINVAKSFLLLGGDGNDTLTGGSAADTLGGGDGNDLLVGAAGNDTMIGGDGNDIYWLDADTSLGSDILNEAGGGIDVLNFSGTTTQSIVVNLLNAAAQVVNANLTLTLGAINTFDNILGGALNDTLTGNNLNNSLVGGLGNDVLTGGFGGDVLEGGGGNDSLTGGGGNDTYWFDADTALGSDTIDESGGGTDLLNFSATTTQAIAVNIANAAAQVVNANLTLTLGSATALENVIGGALGDTITGNSLSNTLTAGAGNDVLNGAGERDFLFGESGNDTIIGGAGDDIYYFDADTALGSDTLDESGGGIDLLSFTATTTQAIVLNLSNAAAQVVNSNLTLTLGSGTTFENVYGAGLADTITGNSLNNSLVGLGGNDTLNGASGNDVLEGSGGNDTLIGDLGNDVYWFAADVGLGSDTINESAGGTDLLNFSATTTLGVTVNLSTATAQVVNSKLTLTLGSATSIKNVIGSALGDTIIGNTLANSLVGGGGNDTLGGDAGNDVLEGGAGNDTLTGGTNNDTYWFDADSALGSDTINESAGGTDLLNFSATTTQSILVHLATAGAQVVNSNLTLTLGSATAVENVIGGALADILVGNSLGNNLQGGGGRDLVIGGLGADTLSGQDGDDILIAGTTSYDANDAALLAVLAEWNSADDYTTRTTKLRDGVNGVQLTAGVTVFNDSSADTLTGGNNQDWISKALDDFFADPEVGELVEAL